ncbi:hypothetical protein DT019_07385 [Streptomyces sp. SDr-06]|uniref:hypothetical protein n=1 Tax=Streptomyces sp. SDr-06 TaxID=2267702 RepID=UPI000DE96837|nr:hypothetical protein [Streptomyces sp. SDr-06]RCH69694.1 hypothetical protein DT019_07385 [Streptomyces sp. SDr-06]
MRPPGRPRIPLALAGALAAASLLGGCTTGHSEPAGTATLTASGPNSPSPQATSPEQLCVHLITYWARQELDAGQGAGLDYQEKGLSDGQNEILLAALSAARTERAAHGAAAGDRVIDERARRGCAERYRNGPPTTDPWAQTKQPTPSGSA